MLVCGDTDFKTQGPVCWLCLCELLRMTSCESYLSKWTGCADALTWVIFTNRVMWCMSVHVYTCACGMGTCINGCYSPAEWGMEALPQVGVLCEGGQGSGGIPTPLVGEDSGRKSAIHPHGPLRTHALLAVKYLEVRGHKDKWSITPQTLASVPTNPRSLDWSTEGT